MQKALVLQVYYKHLRFLSHSCKKTSNILFQKQCPGYPEHTLEPMSSADSGSNKLLTNVAHFNVVPQNVDN